MNFFTTKYQYLIDWFKNLLSEAEQAIIKKKSFLEILKVVSKVDTEHITKENVIALTNVNEKRAVDILEIAVREGYFGKNGDNDYYLLTNELTKLN